MSSVEEQLSSAIQESLATYIDEDICEYIQNILEDDPHDSDARTNVEELLRGSIDDDSLDLDEIVAGFFQRLSVGDDENQPPSSTAADDEPLQKLDKAVTMKANDVKSYAMGLSAESMNDIHTINHEDENISSIASFYANMIDISDNQTALSERQRRKERQKQIRLEMEEAERKRAIEEAMNVLNDDDDVDGENVNADELLSAAEDNSADVHCRDFDLPNLRGGGPDLLQGASLTLARGRRYGLMGRNGCGKF